MGVKSPGKEAKVSWIVQPAADREYENEVFEDWLGTILEHVHQSPCGNGNCAKCRIIREIKNNEYQKFWS